jgi:predicted nucleic acid-binding protein
VRRAGVVFDVNVLVGAVAGGRSDFESWPSPPPASDNAAADCVGIANDAREFSLWLSEYLLAEVVQVLTDPEEGFGWEVERADEYVDLLWEIADASGGGVVEPRVAVNDCAADFDDNRVLEVALEANADLIVSYDSHLLEMSPWRGRLVLTPREFATRTDAMRRAERRRGSGDR